MVQGTVDLGTTVITAQRSSERSIVPTASVLVCFNMDVIKEILATARVGGNVLEATRNAKDAMLFSNVGNPNFESFEHSLGAGTNSQKMTLTLIDPNHEFEKKFLSDNILRDAVGYMPPLHREEGEIDEPPVLTPFEVGDWKKYLRALYGNKFFYFAYGVGLDIDHWAGPHVMKLINADVTIQDARRITLEFAPIVRSIRSGDRRGPYGELVDIHMGGLLNTVMGESGQLDFKSWNDGNEIYERKVGATALGDPLGRLGGAGAEGGALAGIEAERSVVLTALKKLGKEKVAEFVDRADIHLILTDLIRNYIQKATGNSNVIVLLPNINYVGREFIDDAYKSFERKDGGGGNVWSFGQFYKTFHYILNRFGTQLARTAFRDELVTLVPVVTPLVSPVIMPWIAGDPSVTPGVTPTNEDIAFKVFSEDWLYRAQLVQHATGRLPDNAKAIFGFTDTLKKVIESIYKLDVFYAAETNLDIIKLWSEQKAKFGDSGGADYLFGGSADFDIGSPVIVFGDRALITNFLYGQIDLEQYYNTVQGFKDKQAVITAAEKLKDKLTADADEATLGAQVSPGGYFPDAFPGRGVLPPPTASEIEQAQGALEQQMIYDFRIRNLRNALGGTLQGPGGGAAVAQIDLAPIHPLDKLILTDRDYHSAINYLLESYPTRNEGGLYDPHYLTTKEIGALLDRGAYLPVTGEEGTNTTEKLRELPIFRFNVKNSNILDFNYKYGPIYFGLLQGAFAKSVKRRVSDDVGGLIEERFTGFDFNNVGDVLAYITKMDYANLSSEDQQILTNDLMFQVNPTGAAHLHQDALQFATGAIALYEILTEDQRDQMLFVVNQRLPGQPTQILASFLEDMMKRAHQMNITTLPMCHLSKITTLMINCIVIAEDVPITQQIRPERGTLNNFFSGGYRITGFKHTINSREASSTFQLHRNWRKPPLPESEDIFDLGGQSADEYAESLAGYDASLGGVTGMLSIGRH